MKAMPTGLKCFNLVAVLLIATSVARLAAASECQNVNADQTAMLTSPSTTAGTITHGGFLDGATTDTFTSALTATPDPNTFSFTDTLTITTKEGTLTDTDVTIYNLLLNAFSTISQISSGTGELADASGNLFISGSSTDGINFVDKIIGKVCLVK